jgi:hypothetical protein
MEYLIHYLDGRTAWREMGPEPLVEWQELDEKTVLDAHGNEHLADDWQAVQARDGNFWVRILRFRAVELLKDGREIVIQYYQVPDDWKHGDPIPNAPR